MPKLVYVIHPRLEDFPRNKRSSLFAVSLLDKEKSFIALAPGETSRSSGNAKGWHLKMKKNKVILIKTVQLSNNQHKIMSWLFYHCLPDASQHR